MNSSFEQVVHDFTKGYPKEPDLFYQCLICNDILPSSPAESVSCMCDNLAIDVEWGRLAVNDKTKVRLLRKIGS